MSLEPLSITRLHSGAYQISSIVNGHLFTKTYYFYTKKEAVSEYKQDVRDERKANP